MGVVTQIHSLKTKEARRAFQGNYCARRFAWHALG